MRKVLLDAHTHTVASGHAYSSLQEMAKAQLKWTSSSWCWLRRRRIRYWR